MRVSIRTLAVAVAALLTIAAPASAQSVVSTPSDKTLYKTGPTGRYLMDGTWLFKLDNHQSGPAARVRDRRLEAGHGPQRLERRRRQPAVVPRRRRLVPQGLQAARRPPSAASWVVRFESVNYRSKIWLNGKPIGKNRGAYLPFEIRLPAGLLKRGGVNHLVIRVDSRRKQTDFPPSGPVDRGQADGRLVELRRPAARGLPAQDQRRRLQHGRRPARPARAPRARRRSPTA